MSNHLFAIILTKILVGHDFHDVQNMPKMIGRCKIF